MPISQGHRVEEAAIDTRWSGRLALALLFAVLLAPRSGGAEERSAALTRSLAGIEAQHGGNSPELLPVITELARVRGRDGALDEASALRRRALAITLAASGPDSLAAGEAMAALATVHIDRRRYLDAEPLLIAAERVLTERLAENDARIAAILAARARVDVARGDTAAALARGARAVEVARRDRGGCLAEALRALGAALTSTERFGTAESVLLEALTLDRQKPGDDSVETARSLSELAHLYLRWGRAADALPLLEQAGAIDQQHLGAGHPFIADDLHDLGLVYEALKRPDAARRSFLAALAVLERGDGRETPRVAYVELDLSRIESGRGDSVSAETAFRDARRILNKAEAEEHRRERRV